MTRNRSDFHTLLLFPPVWTPVTPYLALPVITGFLKSRGYDVSQFDASLDFFTSYLFTPDVIGRLKEDVLSRLDKTGLDGVPAASRRVFEQLAGNDPSVDRLLADPQKILNAFRNGRSFFDPETCIRAQRDVYDLLRVASLSRWPLRMTFNKYFHSIDSFEGMVRHCDDEEENLFLPYYRQVIPEKLDSDTRLAGISISTAQQLVGALTLARWIKRTYPRVHVTLGGKHLLRLKEAFARAPGSMNEFCHSLIMDNGERPLLALIKSLQQNGDLSRVQNLVHVRDGSFIENPIGPREPLEQLPTPDFTDLNLNDYFAPSPLMPVRISEGCYWGKCTFCARYYQEGFAAAPPEKVADQLVRLHERHGVSDFTVNDDCLTPRYLESLSRNIIDRGLNISLSLWCKPVHSFTRQRLELMYEAGVRLIRWGVETGHPRILKLMNKGTRLDDTVRVLHDASEAGIWNHACMILGFPTETLEEAEVTIDFLSRHKDIIHSSILYQFTLLDHSYIYNNPREFGITEVQPHGNVFSNVLRYTTSRGMKPDEFQRFYDRTRRRMRQEVYRDPFWYHLLIREYLYLISCGTMEKTRFYAGRSILSP